MYKETIEDLAVARRNRRNTDKKTQQKRHQRRVHRLAKWLKENESDLKVVVRVIARLPSNLTQRTP